jgi:cysteine desulfurase
MVMARRTLVTPTTPSPAAVSDKHVEVEDEAEVGSFKVVPRPSSTGKGSRPIYLDMQATTPMDPRVLDRMMPLFTEQYGNPHSRTHAYGWEAEAQVEEARKHVADLIGAGPKDIVFTSGATESNNLIVKGIANFHKSKKRHLITTQTVSNEESCRLCVC